MNRFAALRILYLAHRDFFGAYPSEGERMTYRKMKVEFMLKRADSLIEDAIARKQEEDYYRDFVEAA